MALSVPWLSKAMETCLVFLRIRQARRSPGLRKPSAKFYDQYPLGSYNPDWAYVEENNGERRLYFVIETKGGSDGEAAMRPSEKLKTDCARKHFAALDVGEDFQYKVQTEFQ